MFRRPFTLLSDSLFPWRRVREDRERFRSDRRGHGQTDAEFLKSTEPIVPKLALLIREIVAGLCGVPALAIHSDDCTTRIEQLMGAETLRDFILAMPMALPESVNSSEFFWEVEQVLQERFATEIRVGEAVMSAAISRWLAGEDFGAWASWFAHELAKELDPSSLTRK